jgi:hypothetical protein
VLFIIKRCIIFSILLVWLLPTSICGVQVGDESVIEQEIDNFYKHRKRNVEEARNIIDALYQRFPDNARVVFTKIEFDVTYLGRFEDAMELMIDKDSLLTTSFYAGPVEDISDKLNSELFKPLVMTVKDRRVIESAYIPNIKVDISYPRGDFLDEMLPIQLARLKYIRSSEFSTAKRFHFVPDQQNSEKRIIQIDYYPVSKVADNYMLIIDRKRRYPFEFSTFRTDTVDIYWHNEWQLREWIPDDMVTLTYPDGYTILYQSRALDGLASGSGFEKTEIRMEGEKIEVTAQPNTKKKMTTTTMKIVTLSLIVTSIGAAIIISSGGV